MQKYRIRYRNTELSESRRVEVFKENFEDAVNHAVKNRGSNETINQVGRKY